MEPLDHHNAKPQDAAPTRDELMHMAVETFGATLASGVVVYLGYLAVIWLWRMLGPAL